MSYNPASGRPTFTCMEFTKWLNGEREYWSGVKLLKAHVGESFIVNMLSSGMDRYNQEKLLELITERAEVESNEKKQLPSDVVSMGARARQAMDERAALKAQLRVLPAATVRRKAAFAILSLNDELNELFRQLDFFDRFGHLPRPDALPEDPIELIRRRGNLRTYVSRAKRAGDVEKLKQLQKELDLIERKLKEHE